MHKVVVVIILYLLLSTLALEIDPQLKIALAMHKALLTTLKVKFILILFTLCPQFMTNV